MAKPEMSVSIFIDPEDKAELQRIIDRAHRRTAVQASLIGWVIGHGSMALTLWIVGVL